VTVVDPAAEAVASPRRGGLPGAVWAPAIALISLLLLGFGARVGMATLVASADTEQTATPTKTARPLAAPVALAPVQLAIMIPTPTPLPTETPPPTATPLPTPTPAPTATMPAPDPLAPEVLAVAARYEIDTSRRFIVVDPDRQVMLIWEPGMPVREMPVSTGDPARGYRTPAWYGLVGRYVGTFHAYSVYADEGWYLFQDAGDILIHGAPYTIVDGVKIYESLEALGNYPASRGCIRLRPEDARWFTAWLPQGVPLVVLPQPS
jgi:lipoprotein-anchoring transpeptidase ErfK/SrfK